MTKKAVIIKKNVVLDKSVDIVTPEGLLKERVNSQHSANTIEVTTIQDRKMMICRRL